MNKFINIQNFISDRASKVQEETDDDILKDTQKIEDANIKDQQEGNQSKPSDIHTAFFQGIYMNLINEEDIIIEEESREGVSHTASISEIQLLKNQSTQSNNTGYEIQKMFRLLKNNSCSSQNQLAKINNSYNQSMPSC